MLVEGGGLLCIGRRACNSGTCLFLTNQPDAPIIQIYSVMKLYMFRASSLPIIRNFLLYIWHCQVSWSFLMTVSKHSQDGTALSKFILLWNSTCFGHLLCPSSGIFYCTFGTGKLHAGVWWPFPSRVRMELQFHSDSAWKRSSETCM